MLFMNLYCKSAHLRFPSLSCLAKTRCNGMHIWNASLKKMRKDAKENFSFFMHLKYFISLLLGYYYFFLLALEQNIIKTLSYGQYILIVFEK